MTDQHTPGTHSTGQHAPGQRPTEDSRQQAADLTPAEVVERMRKDKIVMLAVTAPSGAIQSHPMGLQHVDDDGTAWFFIGLRGEQADAIAAHPEVNLAFATTGSWLSVSGRAEYVEDRAKAEELWDGQVDSYFPGGLEDPNLGLLRVRSESAQWWGQPGGPVRSLAAMVTSRVLGEKPKGESGTTQM